MTLEKLTVVIDAEISNYQNKLKNATSSIKKFHDDVSKSIEKQQKAIKEFQGKLAPAVDASKKVLKSFAVAVTGAGTALLSTTALTADYRAKQQQLNTAFESAGKSAKQATNTYKGLYRVLGDDDRAVEASTHLAKLATSQEELTQWTTICEGVWAQYGESLPIEGLTEASNETVKVGKVTGVLADALNWAGVSEDKFNEQLEKCNSEAEREALLRETLTGLYGESAELYEENAQAMLEQNEATEAWKSSLAEIGEAMAPVNTMLTQLGADILSQLTPYIQDFAQNYMPIIAEQLGSLGEAIGKVLGFIAEHWQIIVTIAGIIAGIAAVIVTLNTVLTIYSTVMAVVNIVTAPVTLTILAVVAAIAALIAIIVICIQHWDEIMETVRTVVDNIKKWVDDMVEKVKKYFDDMVEKVVNKVESLKQQLHDKWEAIKETVSNKVENLVESVRNKWDALKQSVVEIVSNIKEQLVSKFIETKENVVGKVTEMYENIREKFDKIKNTIHEKIEGAREFLHKGVEKMKGLLDFNWSFPHLDLPHFQITGHFSLNPPSIPHLSVSWYANGGVFDNPTLFGYGNGSIGGLGENGAEAVVPLENNTEWLDRIAEKLGGKIGSTPIVLEVDGKVFAETSISCINELTRQTGRLAINVI